jgi:succinate-acetate transporter protein
MDSHEPHYRRRRSHRGERYRRNAAIWISLGAVAIACGIALVLERRGFLMGRANDFVLGLVVFVAGYAAVMAGCWSWVKAKAIDDAIMLIGFGPFLILFIPFVRLLFIAAPQLIAVGMIMMPAILVSIIAVLPSQR